MYKNYPIYPLRQLDNETMRSYFYIFWHKYQCTLWTFKGIELIASFRTCVISYFPIHTNHMWVRKFKIMLVQGVHKDLAHNLFGTSPIYTDFNGGIRYSCGHISGPHEPIPTKFGMWIFIMLHRYMVFKTLKWFFFVTSSLRYSMYIKVDFCLNNVEIYFILITGTEFS